MYYLGYVLKTSEGEKVEIVESDNGFVQAEIDRQGKYILIYEKTPAMKISLIISTITLIGIVIVIIRKIKLIEIKNIGSKN